jgi:D-proline reductase (dithiol) PrdB
MTVKYIDAITDRYNQLGYDPYRWFHADSPPAFATMKKPLEEAKLGMLGTSGAYAVGQVAYHYKDDTSIRAISKDTPDQDLRFAHITENYLPGGRGDPNCIFPLSSLRQLETEGVVGELADEALSCMGGVYSQRRVREEMLPAIVKKFEAQYVDAVLFVPM